MSDLRDQDCRDGSALPLFRILGRRARAHDALCADSFKTDREYDLIYSSFVDDDGRIVNWERASVRWNFCAYCGPNASDATNPADDYNVGPDNGPQELEHAS